METIHNFYYANTFINFPDIYLWMFLLFTVRLLFKHLLWWAILCANLSLQELFLGSYYDLCWIQPRPWAKNGLSHFIDSLWAIFQAQSRVSVLASQILYWQRKTAIDNEKILLKIDMISLISRIYTSICMDESYNMKFRVVQIHQPPKLRRANCPPH